MKSRVEQTTARNQGIGTATIVAVLVLVSGLCACTSIFPATAEAIYPEGTTLEEAGYALLADAEMWVQTIGGWIAYVFGG